MRGIRRWHLSGDGNRYCRARIRGQKNGRIASSDMDIRIHVVGHGEGFGGYSLFSYRIDTSIPSSYKRVNVSGMTTMGSTASEMSEYEQGIVAQGDDYATDVLHIDLSDYAKNNGPHKVDLQDGTQGTTSCPTGTLNVVASSAQVVVHPCRTAAGGRSGLTVISTTSPNFCRQFGRAHVGFRQYLCLAYGQRFHEIGSEKACAGNLRSELRLVRRRIRHRGFR